MTRPSAASSCCLLAEVNGTTDAVTVYHVHRSEGFLHERFSYVMSWDATDGFFQLEEKKNDASVFHKPEKQPI